MAFWYNIDTKQVETDDTRSPNKNVMGPYETEDEARRALEIAREKSARWDDEDEEWAGRGAADPSAWDDSELED